MNANTPSDYSSVDGSTNPTGAPEGLSYEEMQLTLAEYTALRDEILKRTETRYQIISLTLLIAGTLITFGLQPSSPSYALFVSPVLGAFLAGMWAHNLAWTRRISLYIKDNIETRLHRRGWETAVAEKPRSPTKLASIALSASGVFLGTEIVAILLGLTKLARFTPTDIVLIIGDALSITFTLILLVSASEVRLRATLGF